MWVWLWGWGLAVGLAIGLESACGAGGWLWDQLWGWGLLLAGGPAAGRDPYPLASQLLKLETDRLVLLVSGTFPEPGDPTPGLPPGPPDPQELQLCQQLRSVAASIQVEPDRGWRHLQSRVPCREGPCQAPGCRSATPYAPPSSSRGTC